RTGFDPARAQRHFRLIASSYATRILLGPLLQTLDRGAPGLSVDVLSPARSTAELGRSAARWTW
ncbi:MAG: hypothetical protein QM805_29425, partial [Pseudomonas sp.]